MTVSQQLNKDLQSQPPVFCTHHTIGHCLVFLKVLQDNGNNFKIVGPVGHRYQVYMSSLTTTTIPAGWTQADNVTHLHSNNPTQNTICHTL